MSYDKLAPLSNVQRSRNTVRTLRGDVPRLVGIQVLSSILQRRSDQGFPINYKGHQPAELSNRARLEASLALPLGGLSSREYHAAAEAIPEVF